MRLSIIERNFLSIWIFVLLGLALVLLLLFSGCAKKEEIKSEEKKEISESIQTKGSCIDSDGINEKIKGSVRGSFENGSSYVFNDRCEGSIFLIEYYCDENTPINKNFRCECEKGACV